jgi:Tol biopolymer transport system component
VKTSDRVRGISPLLVVATLVACQGGPLVGPNPGGQQPVAGIPNEAGVGPRAAFVMATPSGLLGAAADGKILGRIVELPSGGLPSGSVLHPDGKRIFFAMSSTDPALGFGSDIYSVNLNGTDLRPVLKRDKPSVFYASPTFDAKGNLYLHRREGDTSGASAAAFVKDSIERVDVSTGARQTLITDGADPTVAPDGTQVVYMKMDGGTLTDLWIASTDGSRSEKFLKTGDWFSYLQGPRISPDGRVVMWSSVPAIKLRNRFPQAPTAMSGIGGKRAHLNIPSEVFIAPLDGSAVRSIYTTNDDVVLSWSPDGTRIAFIMRSTFYVISAADGKEITKTGGIGVSYGDLVWLRSN